MTWANDVRRAKETLDWIEARQGPLKPDGYARIETTVGQVRAMAEGQDDARVQEIRARHVAGGDPGDPHCEWCSGPDYPIWPCDVADLLAVIDAQRAIMDALAAEASDVARENEALIEEVRASGEQIAALAAERDELLVAIRECCESMSRAMTAMARDVVTINALRAGLDALAAERDELRADVLRLIEVRDRAVDGADHAFRERDAAVARAERAEARLAKAARVRRAGWNAVYGGGKYLRALERELEQFDRDGAALAAASEGASPVTTRTITMRCHCGRGVTIGPDPWCEGCVQSAATCDCVPATQGEG